MTRTERGWRLWRRSASSLPGGETDKAATSTVTKRRNSSEGAAGTSDSNSSKESTAPRKYVKKKESVGDSPSKSLGEGAVTARSSSQPRKQIKYP